MENGKAAHEAGFASREALFDALAKAVDECSTPEQLLRVLISLDKLRADLVQAIDAVDELKLVIETSINEHNEELKYATRN